MNQTDAILFQAEKEYGIDILGLKPHYTEPDFVPDDDEWNLRLRGSVDCEDYEPTDEEDEQDQVDWREDEERGPEARLPEGWVMWLDCNSPGVVYMGPEENYDYHDINGYAPVKLSWAQAVIYFSIGEGEERWSLEICKSLGDAERKEIADFNKRWRS